MTSDRYPDRPGYPRNEEMTQIPILHLMNVVADSSIGRIVQRLVVHLGEQGYSWHVGGVRGLGDMREEFVRLGAQVVDSFDRQRGIREYVSAKESGL